MKEKLERFVLFVGGVLALCLGVIVGSWFLNLSPDAQALGIGVLGGCAVGLVPVGVLVAVSVGLARWYDARAQRRAVQHTTPPVVVVTPGQMGASPWRALPLSQGQAEWVPSQQRTFEVIGED